MGTSNIRLGKHVLECHTQLMDVTSMHRPDTSWLFTDAAGHEHRWYTGGAPATSYHPSLPYETPTLLWVKDGEEWWEDDDEPHEVGHTECKQCGEHINPRHCADQWVQHVAGMRYYRVDGVDVSPEEFNRLYLLYMMDV